MHTSRRARTVAAWLVVIAMAMAGSARAAAEPTRAFELAPSMTQAPVDSAIEVIEDPAATLSLDEIRRLPDARWARPRALPLNFGYSHSVWWIRLKLRNASRKEPQERLLQLRSALQDYLTLSIVQGDGRVQTFPTTGDRMPFSARPVSAAMPVFPLALRPGETAQVFVRLATHDGLHEQMAVTVWEPKRYFAAAEERAMGFGVYYGLIGMLIVYSAMIFVWSRRSSFSWYCGYLVSIGMWSVTYSGHGLQHAWPDHPVFNNQILAVAMGCAFLCGIAYTGRLLQLRRAMPRWHRALSWLSWACMAATLPALFGCYAFAFLLSLPLGVLGGSLQLACSVVLARRGSRSALWVLLAWGALLISAGMAILELLGLTRPNPWTATALISGVGLQMLLLGLGLSQTVDRALREKIAIEKAARAAQEGVAARLEQQVKQRTQQLEHANDRLQQLAITDALTGAYNRRHFNEKLEAAIEHRRDGEEQPALCLIDIDHFKAYNDRYGHPKGDGALKAVAAALQAGLRRADERAFRVGGEEFALILPPGHLETQRLQVEKMRQAIQALAIAHEGSAYGVVTASFGLVQFPPLGTDRQSVKPSAIYKEADHMLYSAKATGRNRVACVDRPVAEWAPNTDVMPDLQPEPAPTGA